MADFSKDTTMNSHRRFSLKLLALAPVASAWLASNFAFAQAIKLKATPQDVEGPYYPKSWRGDVDNDLTTFNGKKYGGGIPMVLSGRVRAENGALLSNALVEIWQIDDAGEYRHPDFGGEGPATRGFQGYGRMQTNESGLYFFKTIKPIGYSGRPPHVHFKVMLSGYQDLITEMYFAGENAEGSMWQKYFGGFSKERDLLTVLPKTQRDGATDGIEVAFDIVLARKA
jgi:protocatechuate 3,4-dioxygenase, beta subunit